MAGGLSGILLVDKPEGWTSHDVVGRLRRLTGQRRIGHSGTLDPMATGLLVVFLGRATRAVEFAEGHDKAYTALLRPGVVTDTLDTTGKVLGTSPERPARSELETALARFRGDIWQLPPMYSAIKQGGKKLYEIARAGGFNVKDAHTLEEIERLGAESCLLPVDELFAGRPILLIKDGKTERALRNGMAVKLDAGFEGECRVYSREREFLLLGAVKDGVLHTIKSFFEV